MEEKKSVLIVGLITQIAISLIHSFGKNGIKVYGISKKKNANFHSKYLTKGYTYPEFENEEKLIDFIEEIINKHEVDYVIAFFDNLIIMLNKHRQRLERITTLLFPEEEIFEKSINKYKTLQIAEKLDIPIPKTKVISNLADLDKCKDLNYPVVVKPSSRNYKNKNQEEMDFRRHYFHSYPDLFKFFERYNPCRYNSIFVQEFCDGEEFGFPILFKKGEYVTCMQYQIIRAYPVNGGSSIYRETTKIDPELKDYSIKLLSAMNWDGIAEIDYIKDNKDGKIKLLEVNGRFWAAVALSEKSGVNFPLLVYKSAEGLDDMPVFNYKIGTKCRVLCGDTAWLSDILFNRVTAEETGIIPKKSSAVLSYLKAFDPRVKYDYGSWDDPLPLFSDFFSSFYAFCFGLPRLPIRITLK